MQTAFIIVIDLPSADQGLLTEVAEDIGNKINDEYIVVRVNPWDRGADTAVTQLIPSLSPTLSPVPLG